MKQSKTLRLYDFMPEEMKKMWLTREQVVRAYRHRFKSHGDVNELDRNRHIEKQQFAVQTDEYAYHLKNEDGYYIYPKYELDVFYSRKDIVNFIKKYPDTSKWADKDLQHTDRRKQKDLRSYLNDIRSVRKEPEAVITMFYGERRPAIKHSDPSNQFRLHYAAFLNHSYITKLFCKTYGIRAYDLDIMIFLFTYKFFIWSDLFGCFRSGMSYTKDGVTDGSVKKTWRRILKDGMVEKVTISNKSMYRKYWKEKTIYTTTAETERIVNLYMDYIMYKRKLDYIGTSRNGVVLTMKDIKDDLGTKIGVIGSRAYTFYEYVYDYVNYKSDVELFSGKMQDYMRKSSSNQFYYHPIIYRIAEERMANDGEDTKSHRYIDKMINGSRFGRRS